MSINEAQRRQTAEELQTLRSLLPQSDGELAGPLGYDVVEFCAILAMEPGVNPAQVWRVRDYLVAVARAEEIDPPAFSVLTDSGRHKAEGWFGSWDVPQVP